MTEHLPSPNRLRANPAQIPDAVDRSLRLARERADLHAFVALFDERARAGAARVRDAVQRGEVLPLAGWLIAVKDNIAIKGEQLTCASHILHNYRSSFTATAVERLEAAGAIIIGKTNLDEFAMGSSSENTIFGAVHNPVDRSRVAGGSSGGSAAAVAAGIVHGALGSDTGGSVRQPAAFCGITALKPTYGRVSRWGLVAFGSSLDQIGQFAADCSGLFELICTVAGVDARDSTSADVPPPLRNGGLSGPASSLRIGVPREFFVEGLPPEIRFAIENAVSEMRKAGHSVKDVSLPNVRYSIPVYYILATAEASSNLARYDGARYGWRHAEAESLSDVYEMTRGEGFGDEVRRRIMMGTFVLSAGYFDAYYRKAQQVRRRMAEDFSRAFREVDVLIAPTAPSTAFGLGEKMDDPLAMYLSDVYTVSANLAGIPAISVPVGRDRQGLPIGMQILGPHFSEERILQLGAQMECLREAATP